MLEYLLCQKAAVSSINIMVHTFLVDEMILVECERIAQVFTVRQTAD